MWSSSASRSNHCDTRKSVPRLSAQVCSARYSALMKPTKHLHLLLGLVLLASFARAQNRDLQVANSAPGEESIAAARRQYTQSADISTDADDKTLAQLPRGGPVRPFPRRYPRSTYQAPWTDHGSPGHILIGAAIGFGVGAAIGASHSARNGTPVGGGILIGGGLFGFLGGCVGEAIGSFPGAHYSSVRRRRAYRPSRPEDDEQTVLRPDPKVKDPKAKENQSEASDSRLMVRGVVEAF
jgi:hypothetical protein